MSVAVAAGAFIAMIGGLIGGLLWLERHVARVIARERHKGRKGR